MTRNTKIKFCGEICLNEFIKVIFRAKKHPDSSLWEKMENSFGSVFYEVCKNIFKPLDSISLCICNASIIEYLI